MKSKTIYPSLITQDSITIIKGSKRLIAHRNHSNFKRIVDAVRQHKFTNIERLFDVKTTIEKCFDVSIVNGSKVMYKGRELHNVISNELLNFYHNGLPYRPLMKFIDKLMQNPSDYCKNQFYNYVKNYGLAIDSYGYVYSWKAVTHDLKDKWTQRISYKPGKWVEMDREKCEQDEKVACGPSLHCGAASYAANYGSGNDRYILVRFSPKDVVSCPIDCDWQKLRVCRLKSVREVKKEEIQPLKGKNFLTKKQQNRDKFGRFC